MERKKEKRKKKRNLISSYTVMFIPDTTDHAKSYELSLDTVAKWVVAIIAITAVVICLFVSLLLKSHRSIYGTDGFIERIETLEAENRTLRAELDVSEQKTEPEETERIDTQSVKPEKRARTDVPGVLPIEGKATIVKDPFDDADDHKERMVFLCLTGSRVIATADGEVTEISEDGTMPYTVSIDHKNGYRSVYSFEAAPLVETGVSVNQGDALTDPGKEDFLAGYEIIFGGDPVDPSEMQ
ncbi:MAG: M23 family metallopeptidase [Lachnospiraceae bacterium]|nr:M23 family metallopeptidase [Lachnospiraceae bacterium]